MKHDVGKIMELLKVERIVILIDELAFRNMTHYVQYIVVCMHVSILVKIKVG